MTFEEFSEVYGKPNLAIRKNPHPVKFYFLVWKRGRMTATVTEASNFKRKRDARTEGTILAAERGIKLIA